MEKHCHRCGRAVKDTVHTATTWRNDYYSNVKAGKETVTCVDCIKKAKQQDVA